MTEREPHLSALLGSSVFARSRAVAHRIVHDAPGLRGLLGQVERKEFGGRAAPDDAGQVHVDIACAVVEAHLEEMETQPFQQRDDHAQGHHLARVRLVVAALHYLVTEHDLVPDHHPAGHLDDLAVVRWATRSVLTDLPTVSDGVEPAV